MSIRRCILGQPHRALLLYDVASITPKLALYPELGTSMAFAAIADSDTPKLDTFVMSFSLFKIGIYYLLMMFSLVIYQHVFDKIFKTDKMGISFKYFLINKIKYIYFDKNILEESLWRIITLKLFRIILGERG